MRIEELEGTVERREERAEDLAERAEERSQQVTALERRVDALWEAYREIGSGELRAAIEETQAAQRLLERGIEEARAERDALVAEIDQDLARCERFAAAKQTWLDWGTPAMESALGKESLAGRHAAGALKNMEKAVARAEQVRKSLRETRQRLASIPQLK